jgi:hypothetical protein
MEAHFLYYKSEYGGVYGALDYADGFAIVAVNFIVSWTFFELFGLNFIFSSAFLRG